MKALPRLLVINLFLVLIIFVTFSANCQKQNTYKTFVLATGTAHFSFEYPSNYKVEEVEPGENTGVPTQDIAYVKLAGPLIKKIQYHTKIDVVADKPDDLIPDAKSIRERAERNAASWGDYKLLNKSETNIDGVQAYRFDYQNRNIIPAIAGISNEHFIEVYREVCFDAKGFVWIIQMRSDSSTAETDLADFEHVLLTFKILD